MTEMDREAHLRPSSNRSAAARRTGEDGGHVLEQLEPAVERSAGDHLEADVGIPVVDALPPGAAGDDGEDDHPEAVDEAGLEQRPAQAEAADRAQPPACRPPSATARPRRGRSSTKRVLAHANGSSRVEENTTLDISVSCREAVVVGPPAAKPDINRYVVAPIRVV